MRQKSSQDLFAYWRRLSGRRLAPDRGDLDPCVLRQISADTLILDRDQKDDFKITVCSLKIDALCWSEHPNVSFTALFLSSSTGEMRRTLRACADETAPFVAGLSGTWSQQPNVLMEAIFLPLIDENNSSKGLLCGLSKCGAEPMAARSRIDQMELATFRFLNAPAPDRAPPPARQETTPVNASGNDSRRLFNTYFGLSANASADPLEAPLARSNELRRIISLGV
jgi:hypothetical protein